MRNDLIVFEFQNDIKGEVLVSPDIIVRLAEVLTQAFDNANMILSETGENYQPIQIWLTGIERGSLKVAYRALFHPNSTKDLKEALEALNLGLDAMFKIMKIVALGWVGVKAVSLCGAPQEAPEPVPEFAKGREEEFRHTGEQLLSIGYDSGVDRVIITMPELPTMMLTLNPEMHMAALGSSAAPVDASLLRADIEGELEPGHRQIKVRVMGGEEEMLTSGMFRVGKENPFPVLFRWNSIRPRPTGGKVTVKGRLSSVRSAGVQPFNPVPADLRNHGVLLEVQKQIVAE